MKDEIDIERHPWPPFVPEGARLLFLGTFPPQPKRWAMDFFYPNRTNDFWFMMGLVFFGDRYALFDTSTRTFRLPQIKELLTARGIAMGDTAAAVRRLAGNASDKFLEIVEPLDLPALLARMPCCHTVATTGEKAASVVASLTGTAVPAMGAPTSTPDGLHIWRMPSTSRAYPLALEKKAAYYAGLFRAAGIL